MNRASFLSLPHGSLLASRENPGQRWQSAATIPLSNRVPWCNGGAAQRVPPLSKTNWSRLRLAAVFSSFLITGLLSAAPQPVPLMQAVPLPGSEVSFQRDGLELCRYHFTTNGNRPFIFPVIGPAGRSLTRMGHPHDPETHSHHNSIWISHNDVNGVSFWEDRGRGQIVHQRIERFDDGNEGAAVMTVSAWVAETNRVLLHERRLTSVQPLSGGEWLLVIDLELTASQGEVTLGKTPFGLVGVRLAKTIGVRDGGGTIRNSAGGSNEAGCFWKRAQWVDYSGPITRDAAEGVTLFDHPANPNHPSVFHVRDDGWMGASLTHDAPRVLHPGEALRLRYGFYIHAGQPASAALQQQWERFSRIPLATLSPPKTR